MTHHPTGPGWEHGASSGHDFDKDYWEQHWEQGRAGGPGSMAGNPPNPYLARELTDLVPGTALDAGCGAGAEAIWLARAGWRVTAADISSEALALAAARAAAADVGGATGGVRWVEADLGVWDPGTQFDLVTTHYAHPAMPQLDFYERIASWVAPGGTLLVVGHLHDQAAGEGAGHGHRPPAEASATAASIRERLGEAWEIATAEETHRALPGPEGGEVVLRDVVVRAIRRT